MRPCRSAFRRHMTPSPACAGGRTAAGRCACAAVVGTVFCHLLVGRAIWVTALPMAVILATLLHADLTTERALVERKPSGH